MNIIENCGCCGKLLKAPNLLDTCMCRPPYCPECGYCEMHSKYVTPHVDVHANRMEVKNTHVDDTNQTTDSQSTGEVG